MEDKEHILAKGYDTGHSDGWHHRAMGNEQQCGRTGGQLLSGGEI